MSPEPNLFPQCSVRRTRYGEGSPGRRRPLGAHYGYEVLDVLRTQYSVLRTWSCERSVVLRTHDEG
jgi:hypothetical protein